MDMKDQVVAGMKAAGKYSYQLDESTDVSNDAQLMVFVRYEGSTDLKEKFLLSYALEKHNYRSRHIRCNRQLSAKRKTELDRLCESL